MDVIPALGPMVRVSRRCLYTMQREGLAGSPRRCLLALSIRRLRRRVGTLETHKKRFISNQNVEYAAWSSFDVCTPLMEPIMAGHSTVLSNKSCCDVCVSSLKRSYQWIVICTNRYITRRTSGRIVQDSNVA